MDSIVHMGCTINMWFDTFFVVALQDIWKMGECLEKCAIHIIMLWWSRNICRDIVGKKCRVLEGNKCWVVAKNKYREMVANKFLVYDMQIWIIIHSLWFIYVFFKVLALEENSV